MQNKKKQKIYLFSILNRQLSTLIKFWFLIVNNNVHPLSEIA